MSIFLQKFAGIWGGAGNGKGAGSKRARRFASGILKNNGYTSTTHVQKRLHLHLPWIMFGQFSTRISILHYFVSLQKHSGIFFVRIRCFWKPSIFCSFSTHVLDAYRAVLAAWHNFDRRGTRILLLPCGMAYGRERYLTFGFSNSRPSYK